MNHLKQGNSYLTNLTFETPIELDLSLEEVFHTTKAKYKLLFKNDFAVFSPEIFVQIKKGKIYSFPMKGTIDAKAPDAIQSILNNEKESAEHATIVDLIRNDLSCIASEVKVEKYRYIDTLKTDQGDLLQVSSKISGVLPDDYLDNLGDLFFKLLPAGSICGAPKNKTLQIIEEAETYQRGYYTGIVGLFDGKNMDSGVMIRFIENKNNQLFFKSGGGITAQSDARSEYDELIRKIYLPF
jgi:para-aminobenzoate synthetase component 1